MMIDFCSIFEIKVVMRVAVVVEALRTDIWIALLWQDASQFCEFTTHDVALDD